MTAVGAGDDFEEVPVGIFEVDAAAAVVVVDLSGALLERIRPVPEPSLADAPEDAVEIILPDEEGVVLRSDVAVLGLQEGERDAVGGVGDEKWPEGLGRRQAEHVGQESRRPVLVATPDDRVVQLDAHGGLLQVQVNLKSRGCRGFVRAHGSLPHHRRDRATERRPGLGPPLLRGPRAHQVETRRLGPPSLPARGAAADRLHRLRPAPRLDARRDRRRARKAAVGSRAHRPALVPSLARMGLADRRADRRAPAAQARSRRVHRLWLPLARALQARQSWRPRGAPRRRAALLDGGQPGSPGNAGTETIPTMRSLLWSGAAVLAGSPAPAYGHARFTAPAIVVSDGIVELGVRKLGGTGVSPSSVRAI